MLLHRLPRLAQYDCRALAQRLRRGASVVSPETEWCGRDYINWDWGILLINTGVRGRDIDFCCVPSRWLTEIHTRLYKSFTAADTWLPFCRCLVNAGIVSCYPSWRWNFYDSANYCHHFEIVFTMARRIYRKLHGNNMPCVLIVMMVIILHSDEYLRYNLYNIYFGKAL